MEGIQSYVTVSLVGIGVAGMLILARSWMHSIVCNRRMYRMMLTCGIDETTASNPNQLLDIDMQDARKRCRRCPAPKTCDRWLNGEAVPGNDFCPNAERFMAAAEASKCQVAWDLAKRPGRRLDR